MLQKTKQIYLPLIMTLVTGILLYVAPASVYAEPPGTCFVGPGSTQCSKLNITKLKDTDGDKVDIKNNCYTVASISKGQTTVTKADCGQDNRANICPDGLTVPPNNDTSQCPASSTFPNDGRTCGKGDSATRISISIGCQARGNSITDALFAIIRFLSNGVGVVLVASMVYAGIQYSASKGDPNGMNQAINRIRSNVFALLLFIFAYALLNYVIPGQVFK